MPCEFAEHLVYPFFQSRQELNITWTLSVPRHSSFGVEYGCSGFPRPERLNRRSPPADENDSRWFPPTIASFFIVPKREKNKPHAGDFADRTHGFSLAKLWVTSKIKPYECCIFTRLIISKRLTEQLLHTVYGAQKTIFRMSRLIFTP